MLMDLVIVDSYVFSIYTTHWNSCPTWAAEWFIIRMNSFMSLSKRCYLRVFTIWTAERFFISMNSFMCLQMLWLTELFSHFKQLNGFSPVWILACLFKSLDCLNFFSHFEQLNGFSPVWILSWVFKSPDCLNLFSHFEQLNGFSPVWILSWLFKLSNLEHL